MWKSGKNALMDLSRYNKTNLFNILTTTIKKKESEIEYVSFYFNINFNKTERQRLQNQNCPDLVKQIINISLLKFNLLQG